MLKLIKHWTVIGIGAVVGMVALLMFGSKVGLGASLILLLGVGLIGFMFHEWTTEGAHSISKGNNS